MTAPDVPPPEMRLFQDPSGRWGWALFYGPKDGEARAAISSTLRFPTPEIAEGDANCAADAFRAWVAASTDMTPGQVIIGLNGPGAPARLHPHPEDGDGR